MIDGVRLFEITADYRPHNPAKPRYYVVANNAREAKKCFSESMSHMKVYQCKEIEDSLQVLGILNDEHKYIVFGYRKEPKIDVIIHKNLITNRRLMKNDTVLRVLDEHEKMYGKYIPIEIKIGR